MADGDKESFYRCFNAVYDDLYRLGIYLYRDQYLVQESINELFLELWKIRAKLTDVHNKQQYIITIYKRILYKTHAKLNTGAHEPVENIEEIPQLSQPSYEELLISAQTNDGIQQKLKRALTQLTARQSELIKMRFYEAMSYKEMAEKTSLTERTIYNTLHNALEVLRKHMYFFFSWV
ncbi:RNA polymerase sigma-70 factor (ECF subfamily) [Chitinophaga skermanii]|uniref:RNA polymerase sigma-70 factor (ECF subfamily) n=2 Tax=Chitinophaga skermanii TaxID=331697 RepID=A0A327R2K5_9BACT|nr:RNA polymerase sigma-70 factor (ECF subfamily) [Chitinophaga skermanii]